MSEITAAGQAPLWYLSATTVFKNEAPYLEEWLAFCVLEGVEHFLLYDNGSTDNAREVLKPWIDVGIVELLDWPLHWKSGAQTKAFVDALGRLRGERAGRPSSTSTSFCFLRPAPPLPR